MKREKKGSREENAHLVCGLLSSVATDLTLSSAASMFVCLFDG